MEEIEEQAEELNGELQAGGEQLPEHVKAALDEAKSLSKEEVWTLDFLKGWGPWLGKGIAGLKVGNGKTARAVLDCRDYLMWRLLRIRDKHGHLRPLKVNRVQEDLERKSGQRNIVLKARQLGVTTYVAARFFISCITREGTLSVQVAHDQRSAEEIFRIVHRLLENLPGSLRKGALVTSRANVRQIVFPMLDAISSKAIADPNKFSGGLSKVIDGVVDCLNASVWSGNPAS